jgi:hypothetical protein
VSITTYDEFQSLESSEKEGLIIVECAKRLMGWVLHSGSVYKITNLPLNVLSPNSPIQDSGVALTAATTIAGCTAGKYYLDRDANIIYLRTSDSVNPNGKFISCTFRMFFSRSGVNLPNDLASGFEVHWEGMLQSTSEFSVGLDNRYQLGSAIEGSGSITLSNDQDFWKPYFDKFYFDNQRVFVYSWSPLLPATEAKLIFKGAINGKSYSPTKISFKLSDNLNELRAPIPLSYLSDYAGAKIPASMNFAFQRKIYGYLYGHRPTNIDQVADGYELPGTFSITGGGTSITGSGTNFLTSLTPGDVLIFSGDDSTKKVTIEDVTTNTAATITEAYSGITKSSVTAMIIPQRSKTYTNRVFLIAGHALRQPSTTVTSARATTYFAVVDATDIRAGDLVLVDGESATVSRVSGNTIILATALTLIPSAGSTVVRPPVSAVYLDQNRLVVTRDYSVNAASGTLTLTSSAEFNVTPVEKLKGTVAFTNASAAVVGTGTLFTSELQVGDWIRSSGQADYFEVFKITDDTHITLRTNSTYTVSGLAGYAKKPKYYTEGSSVLSCDTLGATDDGTTNGVLLKTAPQIVSQILTDIGLGSLINQISFDTAEALTSTRLGLAIPQNMADTKSPNARDVITKINQSDFGSLVQNSDFELEYHVLRPKKSALTQFREHDALNMAIDSVSDSLAKVAIVDYLFKEADPTTGTKSFASQSSTSQSAQYLAKTVKEFRTQTLLVDPTDALIFANRWGKIFEVAASVIKLDTKMQAARLNVGDVVDLSHEKLYYRVGSTSSRKIAAIQSVKKSVNATSIELEDLANAFSRCFIISDDNANNWTNAGADDKATYGFITDDYGMQNNDPDTFGSSIIW